MYESLASNFADVVQYNKDNRNESSITIDMVCDVLVNEKNGVPVNRLAEVSNMLLKKNKEKCLDYKYNKMVEEMRNTSWAQQNNDGGNIPFNNFIIFTVSKYFMVKLKCNFISLLGRQWMYQTCTEFGFYQTSTARPLLFSETFPVDFFVQQCADIFGPRYNFNIPLNTLLLK